MKCFYVYGEYGPQAGMYIDRHVRAQNFDNAVTLFINYIKRHHDIYWSRMGKHNVHAAEVKCDGSYFKPEQRA